MTTRAEIQQKMRDAAANGASGKVEWCAGWLQGHQEAVERIRERVGYTALTTEKYSVVARILDEEAAR